MPLSPPKARSLHHDRQVECRGYLREDGLWDIEGHLVDTKGYGFANRDRGGRIEAGEPLHEMWLRLTVDSHMLIHDVEAVIDASPFNICPRIGPAFEVLKGLSIGPGWRRAVRNKLGGVNGCTHLVELLQPMATTAFQTIHGPRQSPGDKADPKQKPVILDSCHALSADSEVVRDFWPDFYQPQREKVAK